MRTYAADCLGRLQQIPDDGETSPAMIEEPGSDQPRTASHQIVCLLYHRSINEMCALIAQLGVAMFTYIGLSYMRPVITP